MRTLPSRSDSQNDPDSQATSLLASSRYDDHDRDYDYQHPDAAGSQRRRSYSGSGSESSWTDTGDIGEQLADNDPVRLQLSTEIEDELLAGVQRRHNKNHNQKRVRIQDSHHRHHSRSRSALIDKEAIEVPDFNPRPPTRGERIIGAIMSGRSGSIHGLTGKPLL